MERIGEYSRTELEARFADLEARVHGARREACGALVDEVERFAGLVTKELGSEGAVLEAAVRRYHQRVGLVGRLNPFAAATRDAYEAEVLPVKAEMAVESVLLRRCVELLTEVRAAGQKAEWRQLERGGIAGVYNPLTGRAEWRRHADGGIAGVFDPSKGEVLWREAPGCGVAGVWNAKARAVEWREQRHGAVAGVWNPVAAVVEWRGRRFHGVAGVWSPTRREVEWHEREYHGVAGAYDPSTRAVQWKEAYRSGLACVYFDGETYAHAGSFCGNEDAG